MNRPIEYQGEGMHPTQGTTQRWSLSDYQMVQVKEFVVSHVSLQAFFFFLSCRYFDDVAMLTSRYVFGLGDVCLRPEYAILLPACCIIGAIVHCYVL